MRTYYLTRYNEETKNWVRLAKEFTTFDPHLLTKRLIKCGLTKSLHFIHLMQEFGIDKNKKRLDIKNKSAII